MTWDRERARPKPEKRLAVERDEKRGQRRLTRAQVREIVWRRDKGRCQRCGKKCVRPRETYPTDPVRGEVNEPEGRFKDRSCALDPDRCELLCHSCHFGGESGAHARTADRMKGPDAAPG